MKNILFIIFLGVIIMSGFTENSNTTLAMIFREKDDNIDLITLKKSIENEFSIKNIHDLKDEKGIIIFDIEEYHLVIARMPVEIPKVDFKSAVDYSLLFKNPNKVIDKQKAHIIISINSKK